MSVDNSVCLLEKMLSVSERSFKDHIELKNPVHCPCVQEANETSGCSTSCHSGFDHEEAEFYVCCKCSECLNYKEAIANMVKNELSSAVYWNSLKEILRDYYKVLFNNNSLLQAHFCEISVDCWLESGSAFTTILRDLDTAKFSTEMKFVLYYTLLSTDDSHQLLELLCSEVEHIASIYAKGIIDKRYNPLHSESELHKINYVMKGYQLICEISQKVESLLFGFQKNHLEKFSLTWTLVNKRMYQKCVFDEFSENASQSLLKLKGEVSTKQYIEILTKYIALDDEMCCVKKAWKTVWEALNKYHMSNVDMHRRDRVRKIRKTFESLHKMPQTSFAQYFTPLETQSSLNMCNDWENAINAIKKKWTKNSSFRMYATTRSEKCVSCKAWIDNHKTSCKCTTCLIGGPFFSNAKQDLVKSLCFKCAVMQNAIQNTPKLPIFVDSLKTVLRNRNIGGNILDSKIFVKYHLCWVVFKNQPGRTIFPDASISLQTFCDNCDKVECMIAKKIINNELSKELANMILQYYHPLLISENEVSNNFQSILDFFSEIRKKDVFDFSSENMAEKIFFSFCFSVLITQHTLFTKVDNELMLDNLELRNGDIQLKLSLPSDCSLKNLMDQYDFFRGIPKHKLDFGHFEGRNRILDTAASDKLQSFSDSINSVKSVSRLQKKTSSGISQKTQKITQDERNHRNCIESWIKQTLNFIEEDKKEKGTNKKLEKRNRQKLKKEECKRIEELNTLKSEYQDVYFKEFFAKQELKNYKTSKKKNKKKIIEIENYIRKMSSTKVKIEKNILHTLRIVKSTNNNFKLSYLPSKEELEEAMKKCMKLPEVDNGEKTSISPTSEGVTVSNSSQDNVMDDGVKSSYFVSNAIKNEATVVPTSDPSKNIVTIRRVNIPYLSEPQVTVTAKGKSPKDDKLLYTFINGQIVPASRLEPKMLHILSSPSQTILPKDLYTQFQEETNSTELIKTLNCCESNSCDNGTLNAIQSESEYNHFLNSENVKAYPGRIVTTSASNIYFKRHDFPENDRPLVCDSKIKSVDIGESIPTVFRKDFHQQSSSVRDSEKFDEEYTSNILCKSMKELNISKNNNCRTDNAAYPSTDSHWSWNISIMDQINKGVQVENLMLPPGITLTKIDPERSEKVKAKRQSIDNISYRLKCAKETADLPDEVSVQLPSPNVVSTTLESGFNKKKSRKTMSSKSSPNQNMIANHNHVERYRSLCDTVEPAAIIKKENGMYTIRNPAMRNTNTLMALPRIYSSTLNKSDNQEADCRPVQCIGNTAMNAGIVNFNQDTRFDGQTRDKIVISQRNLEHDLFPEVTIFNMTGNKNAESTLDASNLKAYISKSWNEEIASPKSS